MAIPEPIEDLRNLKIHRKYRIWQPFMEKYDCQVICEIGVLTGYNFQRMIGHKPKIAVAVDAWINDGNPNHNDSGYAQEEKEQQYEDFKNLMDDKPFVHIYREYSHEAVKHFPDEYFDLIYIDADHSYEGCKQDLCDWWPKLKTGGFFTGDDYTNTRLPRTGVTFGVIQAVNEFAQSVNRMVYELTAHGWAMLK